MTTEPAAGPQRTVSVRGRTWRVCDDKPTFWDRAEAGTWEPETLAALASLVGPGDALVDIGAWVGPTTLFAAAGGSIVTAVEADPRALELLRGNLAANPALQAHVAVLAGAASPESGTVRLASPRKPGDSMTSVLVSNSPHVFEAPALTPAEIVGSLPERRSAVVVKIDVEGAEYDLVPALAPLLPADTTALLVAFHPHLLRGSGAGEVEVRETTRRCFHALHGFAPLGIGPEDSDKDPLVLACRENATILFQRAPGES